MSQIPAADIHALISSGRIVEAGTLLTMHGEDIPADARQELEEERERLWNSATTLVAEGEALEQAGWTEEARAVYAKAAAVACDYPGIQETIRRMDEALALTRAVQHRSTRIRAQAKSKGPNKKRSNRLPRMLAGFAFLGIVVGLWYFVGRQYLQSPGVAPSPPQSPTQVLPASETTAMVATTQPALAPTQSQAAPEPIVATEQQPIPEPEPVPQPQGQPSTAEAPVASLPLPEIPPAAPAPPPESPPQSENYIVQFGDSLSLIAERRLCNRDGWQAIHRKNRRIVQHPDKLTPGMQLELGGIESRCPQPQQ